ncbi:MAG: uroporphyrinogen decarboxylase [Spirochaetes bacterium]|nr:uroporphyrinogen decarboxylase [Spirochaetota bacterium]
MEKDFTQFTPEEKRSKRLAAWLNPQGIQFVSHEAETDYKQRAQRFIDVINVEEPDRVPVFASSGSMPAYEYGLDYRTVSYDYKKLIEVYERFNAEHAAELECFSVPLLHFPSKILDIIDYKLYRWPGHGLPDNSRGYQFVEGEYMKADEYDALLKDPSDFWLRTYLPRISGVFEPFTMFKPLTHIVELAMMDLSPLAMPNVQASLQALIEAGKEYQNYIQMTMPFIFKSMMMGYPISMGAFCKAPFDILGDTLRGTKGIMMDMYRQPEKLLAAVDRLTDLTIETTLRNAEMMRSITIMFPLHKGADGWMNGDQFEKFYWPSLKKVINALNNEGFIVILFAEGSYNSRLESINEFTKGNVCWWFDQTDMAKAKKIIGKNCCIWGNVPSSMLVTGTPDQVKERCRQLIETCALGGGYLLCPGASADEAKLENLKAMVQAAKEYGVYRQ